MAGRFVVMGDGDERYRFRIEADDGQLMATSEPYTSKSSALKAVEAIKRNAAVAQIDDESGDDQDATATPRAATPGRLALIGWPLPWAGSWFTERQGPEWNLRG